MGGCASKQSAQPSNRTEIKLIHELKGEIDRLQLGIVKLKMEQDEHATIVNKKLDRILDSLESSAPTASYSLVGKTEWEKAHIGKTILNGRRVPVLIQGGTTQESGGETIDVILNADKTKVVGNVGPSGRPISAPKGQPPGVSRLRAAAKTSDLTRASASEPRPALWNSRAKSPRGQKNPLSTGGERL
jgi:hypothetical protein